MNNENDKNSKRPPYFPMMINLKDKKVLIIGGGHVGARRAKTLLKCGAKIKAVSKNFCDEFPNDAEKILRAFNPDDITNEFEFVIAATNDREINNLIQKISHEKKILVNVSDNKNECDFFFPSLINQDSIAVSVCSAGTSKSLTRKLSDRLRKILPSWINEEIKK